VARSVAALASAEPDLPVLLIGEHQAPDQIHAAMRLGVTGFLSGANDPDVFLQAIRSLQSGGVHFPSLSGGEIPVPIATRHPAAIGGIEPRRSLPEPDGGGRGARAIAGLTQREREVLMHLGRGLQNKLIAYELDLRESTVKVHVRNILKKLDVRSRTQAALLARDTLDL
jgi:two-component system nitrate/nitrite response regulator NarL